MGGQENEKIGVTVKKVKTKAKKTKVKTKAKKTKSLFVEVSGNNPSGGFLIANKKVYLFSQDYPVFVSLDKFDESSGKVVLSSGDFDHVLDGYLKTKTKKWLIDHIDHIDDIINELDKI